MINPFFVFWEDAASGNVSRWTGLTATFNARQVSGLMKIQLHTLKKRAVLLILTTLLCGCEPISLTLFGIATATGVGYSLNGTAYKTFTASIKNVRQSSVKALGRMGIAVQSKDKKENGKEIIVATSNDRAIEIVLEPISENATRIKTTAKNGIFYDRATATEIIIQTERVLEGA